MLSLDVVVRTLADAQRSDLLFRALDSIQNQIGVSARSNVVALTGACGRRAEFFAEIRHQGGVLQN